MFQAVKEMVDAVKPAATVLSDRVSVTSPGAVTGGLVDDLVWTAVFGKDAELRGTARWIVRSLAAAAGIRPASIHDLYMAMGRGEAGGFTVPAINVRAMTYDTRPRGHPLGEEAERRRVHLRNRAVRDRLHRAAAARIRGGGARRRAARGLLGPDLHPGRSRPDQREEIQQPRPRQGARGAARADQGRDRRRLLQHRHRHLDARRSRQADAAPSSRK